MLLGRFVRFAPVSPVPHTSDGRQKLSSPWRGNYSSYEGYGKVTKHEPPGTSSSLRPVRSQKDTEGGIPTWFGAFDKLPSLQHSMLPPPLLQRVCPWLWRVSLSSEGPLGLAASMKIDLKQHTKLCFSSWSASGFHPAFSHLASWHPNILFIYLFIIY